MIRGFTITQRPWHSLLSNETTNDVDSLANPLFVQQPTPVVISRKPSKMLLFLVILISIPHFELPSSIETNCDRAEMTKEKKKAFPAARQPRQLNTIDHAFWSRLSVGVNEVNWKRTHSGSRKFEIRISNKTIFKGWVGVFLASQFGRQRLIWRTRWQGIFNLSPGCVAFIGNSGWVLNLHVHQPRARN